MGYNTTVVIMNDALSYIREDPLFGLHLCEAIGNVLMSKKPIDVSAYSKGGGIYCNAATVIETHHANYEVIVKVGRNCGSVVEIEDKKRKKRL